ncbi:uncharacterized protein LOC143208648 [Lasioglossum baleicum]|uniref:uncharacterized protein LOC143208648 n=1 Tax=Lasioglossum baleicum TaxID=434251 RepID=UPI003FCEC254
MSSQQECRNGRRNSGAATVSVTKMALPTSRNFANCYMELCKQQRLRPLPVICVTLPHNLDFTTDRVKMDDWGPILNSLALDRSLKAISVRSRYQCRKPLEEINSEDKARTMGKAPVVLSRYLLEWMCHSVGQCVRNSPVLTTLELEGIPFPPDCLTVLCVGLSHTKTLRYLSLQRCYVGDGSCEVVCRTVADIPSIRTLNLSSCDLTCKCGPALAAALSRQKLSLYHDTWQQSLRYQEPNLEAMPGLRRLTLNDNPQLGDAAASEIIEAIRDSLWLKALDMQRCGLTDKVATDLFELLDYNTTLVVLDVRQNVNLNEELSKHIMKRLAENNADAKCEYRWLGSSDQNRRVVSAGSRKRTESENKTLTRPRSAMTEYVKRPYQVPPRNAISLTNNARKTRLRPHIPPYKSVNTQRRQQDRQQSVQSIEANTKQKVSLHLDLRPHIQSVMGEASGNTACNQTYDGSVQQSDRTSLKNVDLRQAAKVDAATQMADDLAQELDSSARIEMIEIQLAEAKVEHERLVEETRQSCLLLEEERDRREEAEAKLNAMKQNLDQLEKALKEKEQETSGSMMLSQQSMDEICGTFQRLMNVLDSVTKNPNRTEAAFVKDDIKKCVNSVIRHTKSENLRRTFTVDLNNDTEPIKKFAKSESDVRSTSPPVYLERNIGDSPDVRSPSLDGRIIRHEMEGELMSPRKRARALFAQIVQGDAVVEFSTNED